MSDSVLRQMEEALRNFTTYRVTGYSNSDFTMVRGADVLEAQSAIAALEYARKRGRDVMAGDVMTAEEVGSFLNFNPVTVRSKAANGEIPGQKVGKEWRFSRSQLLSFIEGGK